MCAYVTGGAPAVNPLLCLLASQDGGRLVRAAASPGRAARRFVSTSAREGDEGFIAEFSAAPEEPGRAGLLTFSGGRLEYATHCLGLPPDNAGSLARQLAWASVVQAELRRPADGV